MDQITDQSQYDEALKSHKSVVIIFTAIWSHVGEITKRNFEKVGAQYPALYQAWISTDESPELTEQHGVTAVPTVFGYKGEAEVNKYIGPQFTEEQVKRFIEKVL
ncbi:hypothetical protein BDW74DRAFT_173742 [Aspergillus multicolor]|uniref:thioredoxin family protein n=1 Tax=Aspergillus multicolor TaxID=41759 RepID=UPI003CCD56AE